MAGFALEWLKDVYLPQTEPCDASDARLIILDGHGSHAQVSLWVFSRTITGYRVADEQPGPSGWPRAF
ncbi:Uncharacterized protein HZ326_26791 [Fusarium oxysporum f. sp. albedinis]|nr:hypothetical protein HZ326_30137 [Fusarium oxysporum f. sp. albedinis]KAJ0130109.1 Uncharacterized protein HZ326_26791 [Fusarium oxysporum f. sp. albedinis]